MAEGIIGIFEADGYVVSPFLGEMATEHFEYDRTLKSGVQFVFQGVDYFKFGPNDRFASMLIFFDTQPVREDVVRNTPDNHPTPLRNNKPPKLGLRGIIAGGLKPPFRAQKK